jgi:transketolase
VPGRIADRFATEGWQVATVDGRDPDELEKALSERAVGVPNAVIATVLDGEEAA